MMKLLAKTIFIIIFIFDQIIYFLLKKNFSNYLYDFLRQKYSKKKIEGKNVVFFTPSKISQWRVDTIFEKEPETIKFIEKMKNGAVFFDIGANIGIYSVFAAIKKKKLKVFSFEPSTSNLALLSRNIYLNSLSDRISIIQLPLGKKSLDLNNIREGFLEEGGSMNAFGINYGFDGKKILAVNKYKILGTSLDFLIKNRIIPQPNYIKIDVDGIEHLILAGGLKCLKNKNLKQIIIEINENFTKQFNQVLKILKKSGFKVYTKERAERFYTSKKFNKNFNYIFSRKQI